jgi:hypothetical protein
LYKTPFRPHRCSPEPCAEIWGAGIDDIDELARIDSMLQTRAYETASLQPFQLASGKHHKMGTQFSFHQDHVIVQDLCSDLVQ